MEDLTETLMGQVADTETLMARVTELVPPRTAPPQWGNALMPSTPMPLAIRDLALRTQALEKAVREIALEVQKLSARD